MGGRKGEGGERKEKGRRERGENIASTCTTVPHRYARGLMPCCPEAACFWIHSGLHLFVFLEVPELKWSMCSVCTYMWSESMHCHC